MHRIGLAVLASSALSLTAVAQCGQWTAGGGYPGVVGPNPSRAPTSIQYLGTIDPDGPGPSPLRLVASGDFGYAGATAAGNLAQFDPATDAWSGFGFLPSLTPLGPLVPLANGDCAVLGFGAVARLSGDTYTPLAWVDGVVWSLVELSNGDLVIGGSFVSVDGVPCASVARWDGTTWSPFGSGIDGVVYALATLPGDVVVAGGQFATAGGGPAQNVALWDGSAWFPVGGGTDERVLWLARHGGDLVAAGTFATAGGVPSPNLARWDGVAWSSLGGGVAGGVRMLALDTNGDLLVGGSFASAGGVPANNIARWDGATWSAIGEGLPSPVRGIRALPGVGIFAATDAGGYLPTFGGDATALLARWDGTRWRAVGTGIDATVRAATIAASGDLVFGGDFAQAGDVEAAHVASWNGTDWAPLGGGVDGSVRALTTLVDGTVVAGGDFTAAGGAPANRVARWDGSAWAPMCAGADATVRALAAAPGGGVVAGGDFTTAGYVSAPHVAFFDGYVWSALGAGTDGAVHAVAVLPDGDVIVGGDFTQAGGAPASRIARWDGTGWSPLGAGTNGRVAALAVLPNGDVVAGGTFTTAGGAAAHQLARWDGVGWTAMPAPQWSVFGNGVTALTVLADGDLVATNYNFGIFAPGQPASLLVRWNGSDWSSLATPNGIVNALAADGRGQLAVGGVFSAIDAGTAGDVITAFAARYGTTCPAVAAPFGVGCAGRTLTAAALPWVDATFRADGSGLPDPAVVVALSSFTSVPQGVLPLATVFAAGQPGCDVLVEPDILQALLPNGGAVQSSLYLPPVPPLVGLSFFHQMIAFEVDAVGFVGITASNGLELLVGDL